MSTIDCGLCGASFDPAIHVGCASCPMGGHCTLSCCPNCGYTTVDLDRSKSARFVGRLLGAPRRAINKAAPESLLAVGPGDSAEVAEFAAAMPPEQVALLRTYGVDVGRSIKVVQHRPMTVLEVDQTEVALESDLASLIMVRLPVRPF